MSQQDLRLKKITLWGYQMKWFWEPRSNAEFTPPHIATFLDVWDDPKSDMKSPVTKESEVFVREVVQNFVDAARDEKGRNPETGVPSLTFRFVELEGADAKNLVEKLDLKSISDRYSSFDDNTLGIMRLKKSDTVLGKHDKIRLLVLSETNTCGMYGQWKRSDEVKDAKGNEIVQRMRDALLASVRGNAGKGLGSFGEGKKAVINISDPRTLFAYTCFDPNTSIDDVSRRFMGGVYWQNHIYDNRKYAGFAMIGGAIPVDDVRPEPLSDSAADAAVKELEIPGLELRDDASSRGTTYVFVDHSTTPAEVAESIARNWWPLILDQGAEFRVIRENGTEQPIEFNGNLQPFLDAYSSEESKSIADWNLADDSDLATRVETIMSSVSKFALGELKLAIDLRPVIGWSRKDPETNTSLVALIRDGMIISYQHFPKSKKLAAPFVRGTFTVNTVKHPISENYLRSVEPPLHNKWQEDNRELDVDARKAAKDVYNLVTHGVRSFRDEYVASTPSDEQDFKIFRDNLSLAGGKRVIPPPPPPPATKTAWSLLSQTAEVKDNKDGRRIAQASRTIQLAKPGAAELEASVEVGWEILEDNSWVEADQTLLADPVENPDGWVLVAGEHNVFTGTVKDTPALFAWKSRAYRELWTLRPYMRVTSLKVEIEEGSN
jgi:hypothetical protein